MNSALIVSTNFRGAPGTPTSVTASAASMRATVNWSAPTNAGGSPITSYTVRVYTVTPNSQVGSDIPISDPALRTRTITGLTNGTFYYFTVTANNTAGSSLPGVSNNVKPEFAEPNTPTLTVSATTQTPPTVRITILITYSIPTDGATQSGYQYYFSPPTSTLPENPVWTNSSQSFILDNLTPNTLYYVWGRVSFVASVPFSPVGSLSFTPTPPLITPTILAASYSTTNGGTFNIQFNFNSTQYLVPDTWYYLIRAYYPTNNFVDRVGGSYFSQSDINANIFNILINPFDASFEYNKIQIIKIVTQASYIASGSLIEAAAPFANASQEFSLPVKPGPPTITSITLNNGEASVYYTVGATGGTVIETIENYLYSVDGTNYIAFNPASIANPLTISGVANGTIIRIKARNGLPIPRGDSIPSNAVTASYVTPNKTTLRLDARGSSTATLTILYVALPNSPPVVGYQYYYSLDPTTPTPTYAWLDTISSGTSDQISLINLVSESTYYVWARRTNGPDIVTGTQSDALSFITTTSATVPEPPIVYLVEASDASLTLSYDLSPNDGGSPITAYLYSLDNITYYILTNGINNGITVTIPNPNPNRNYTISGLTNGTLYTVYMKARNAIGDSINFTSVSSIPRIEIKFVAGGFAYTGVSSVFTSPDGSVWTSRTNPMPTVNAVAWNGSYWLAVGNHPNNSVTAIKSTDGYDWVASGNPFPGGTANAIAWNGSYWIAVGYNISNTITISKSDSTGSIWTPSTDQPFYGYIGTGIAWNSRDSYWVAVGTNSAGNVFSAISTTGSTWTNAYNRPPNITLNAVAWNGSYWMAVGGDLNNITKAFKSGDGLVWVNGGNPFPDSEFSQGVNIAWNGSYWVAVGGGGSTNNNLKSISKTSDDGITWIPASPNLFTGGIAYGITWSGSKWFAAGGASDGSLSVKVVVATNTFSWNSTSGQPNLILVKSIASKFTQYLF